MKLQGIKKIRGKLWGGSPVPSNQERKRLINCLGISQRHPFRISKFSTQYTLNLLFNNSKVALLDLPDFTHPSLWQYLSLGLQPILQITQASGCDQAGTVIPTPLLAPLNAVAQIQPGRVATFQCWIYQKHCP